MSGSSSTVSTGVAATANAGSNYAPRAGFDSSGACGLYHSARPDYPTEAIRAILTAGESSSQGKPLNIIEVGSGTGISTQSLLEGAASIAAEAKDKNDEDRLKIQRYLAVDPSVGMRQDWDKNIKRELLPKLASSGLFASAEHDFACVEGTFENLAAALKDGKQGIYDLVFIAQAWHWCPNIPASLNAIAEALRAAGRGHLALIWNMEDQSEKTGAKWVKEVRELYEKYEADTPQYRHRYWASMYKEPALLEQFDIVEPKYYHRKLPTTIEGVKNRILSKSYITVLPEKEQRALTDRIEELLSSSDDVALQRSWIDREKGIFEYPYETGERKFWQLRKHDRNLAAGSQCGSPNKKEEKFLTWRLSPCLLFSLTCYPTPTRTSLLSAQVNSRAAYICVAHGFTLGNDDDGPWSRPRQ